MAKTKGKNSNDSYDFARLCGHSTRKGLVMNEGNPFTENFESRCHAKCPECGTLEHVDTRDPYQDYYMITCSSCQHFYTVDVVLRKMIVSPKKENKKPGVKNGK